MPNHRQECLCHKIKIRSHPDRVAFLLEKNMTKQEMKELIVGCAEKLGRAPSCFEVARDGPDYAAADPEAFWFVQRGFARMQSGKREQSGQRVPLDKLFVDWAGVVQTLKKAPSLSEYEMLSKYSVKPLVRCFGTWRQVPFGLKQYAERAGLAEQWSEALELAAVKKEDEGAGYAAEASGRGAGWPAKRTVVGYGVGGKRTKAPLNGPAYGPPMWPGPLAHSPANELGVVFLFGAMAERMGFVVHRLQTEFPDCEAIRHGGRRQVAESAD